MYFGLAAVALCAKAEPWSATPISRRALNVVHKAVRREARKSGQRFIGSGSLAKHNVCRKNGLSNTSSFPEKGRGCTRKPSLQNALSAAPERPPWTGGRPST